MINIDNVEKFVTEELAQGEHFSLRKEGWIELITRLRQAEKDAARYRWLRRKFCLTGNGDGTCCMHAINLPANIKGWPEPIEAEVMNFCDAAIDAARSQAKEGGA